jgi:phenylacetate-CoA ligase
MLPRVVRQVILPFHEALLGRSTFSIWRRLETRPAPEPDWLREVQRGGLATILEHARSQIPYWRDRLANIRPVVSETDPSSALACVPVLTRAEIGRHREAMRWPSPPGKILMHRSGGTTDDNLTFYWGRTRQSWDRAMRYRGLARYGILPGDRILHIWPRYPARNLGDRFKQALRDGRDRLTNDEVIDARPFSPERLDAVLRRCAGYRPVLLIGYPSWLTALAERVRAAHAGFRLADLRLILCTGEVLFAFQRRLIEETFGVRVAQEYGSQDAGLIAHEDPAGDLRLNAEQMVVEILRDGEPAAPGELGEVVITHFYTEMMPFIRYATGDVVRRPKQEESDLGRPGLPVFPLPEGRTSDVLAARDGTLCPMRPVVESLVGEAGLRDFSLYQPTEDRLVVLFVEGTDAANIRRPAAEEVLRSFLGENLRLEWRGGRGFEPFTSGKRRFVCSPAGMRLIGHDRESGVSRARAWPQRLLELMISD